MGKPKAMVGHQRVREKDGYSGCQSLINNNIKKKYTTCIWFIVYETCMTLL